MMERVKRVGMLLVIVVLLVVITTQGLMAENAKPREVTVKTPYDLRVLTFLPGSAWYVYTTAIGELWRQYLPPGSRVDVIPSPAAGLPTTISVGIRKEYNVALMGSDEVNWGYEGRRDIWSGFPKGGVKNIRTLISLMDGYSYGVAITKKFAEKYGVWSLKDLVEKKPPIRIRTMPMGGSGELRGRFILEAYGITYEDIKQWGGEVVHADFKTCVTAIMDGHADAFLQVIVKGHPAWTELTTMVDIVFLPMDEETIKKVNEKYDAFRIPIEKEWGLRGVTKDVPMGMGWNTVMIVRDEMPFEVAYVLVKALDENVDYLRSAAPGLKSFNPKVAWKEEHRGRVPLHPGAEAYFRDKGYMK